MAVLEMTRRQKGAIKRFPDEEFLAQAVKSGRCVTQFIGLKELGRPDTRLQARVVHLDMDHVRMLHELLESQEDLAPIVVFQDASGKLMIADGFHRHETYRRLGRINIPAHVIQGTWEDAIAYAAMCNRRLSLPRRRGDVKKAVFMLFELSEWWHKSDSLIAKHVGCSAPPVTRYRAEFSKLKDVPVPELLMTKRGLRRRSDYIPEIKAYKAKRGRPTLTAMVGGKQIRLGTDPEKAPGLLREAMVKDSEDNRPIQMNHSWYFDFLRVRGVTCETLPIERALKHGLCSLKARDAIFTWSNLDTVSEIPTMVGRLEIARDALGQDVSLFVICPYARRNMSLARLVTEKRGIRFVTPDEFVEILKSEASDEGGSPCP